MWDSVKSQIQWLKDNGIWDKLVALAESGAKVAAFALCSQYLTSFICAPLVEALFDLFFKKK